MTGSVSLFRKWRSQNFTDLLGQDAVVRTLRNVLSSGSPARAYLFCGPRGTGKTSTARIFAKALCCEQGPQLEPCNACSTCSEIASGNCMDVLEIDAASHTQVEKIRDFIVDKVHFAPTRARFKVYIIDEVHKLSSASFNALLKTLEEPPPHVVFILATTHPHELLPTILSRCQRYDFKPFSLGQVRAHMNYVAQQEGFTLEPEASLCLARAAGGSMRDALVLLEQAYAYCGNEVTTLAVTQMLGWLPAQTLEQALQYLQRGEAGQMMMLLQSLAENGQDFVRFVDQLVDQLRLLMLLKVQAVDSTFQELPDNQQQSLTELAKNIPLPQILSWLRALIDAQQSIREGGAARLLCEMAMVQLASANAGAANAPGLEALVKRIEALESGRGAAPVKPQTFLPPTLPIRTPEAPPPVAAAPPASPSRGTEGGVPDGGQEGPFRNPLEGGQTRNRPAPQEKLAPAPAPPRPSPIAPSSSKGSERPEAPSIPSARKPDVAEPGTVAAEPGTKPAPGPAMSPDLKEFWLLFLSRVKQSDKRLFAVIQEAWPAAFDPPKLLLMLPKGNQWHFEKIMESKSVIEQLSQELLGKEAKLECRFDATGRKPSGEEEHKALVKKASGLFAGKIVEP